MSFFYCFVFFSPIYFKSRRYSVCCYCTGCVSTVLIVPSVFLILSRRDPEPPSTKCPQTCSMFCWPLKWNRWENRRKCSETSCCIFFQNLSSFDCDVVCLCRSINTPIWPSTLFSALWHSKTFLFLSPVVAFSVCSVPLTDPWLDNMPSAWPYVASPLLSAPFTCFRFVGMHLSPISFNVLHSAWPVFTLSSIYVHLFPRCSIFVASQAKSACAKKRTRMIDDWRLHLGSQGSQ